MLRPNEIERKNLILGEKGTRIHNQKEVTSNE